jgi:hypothetical protein
VDRVFLLDGHLILANIDSVFLCRIIEDEVRRISSARDVGPIMFCDIMDSDFDDKDEVFIISGQGLIKYSVQNNQLDRISREDNMYNIVSLHKGLLDGRSEKVIGRVAEISDPIYGSMLENIFMFSWIFPGFDRKKRLIEYDMQGAVVRLVDFDRDDDLDIMCLQDDGDKLRTTVFFNDDFNNFYDKTEFTLPLSGIIDAEVYDNSILYILVSNGIQRVELDKDLIIKENFFNINGCAGFEVLGEDEIYLLRADNTLDHLLKLNQGGQR